MNERRALDLIISLLPDIKLKEKITLLKTFETEDDLYIQSREDIQKILKRELKQFWDISEIRERAGSIDTVCRMRSMKWVSWTDIEYPPLLR